VGSAAPDQSLWPFQGSRGVVRAPFAAALLHCATAWLYAAGGRNFPHRIVQLGRRKCWRAGASHCAVVPDRSAAPPTPIDLASAIAALVSSGAYGVYHLTNAEPCSRYEFAREIPALRGRDQVAVEPITLAITAAPRPRPHFAPLANTAAAALGIRLRPWQDALAEFLEHPS